MVLILILLISKMMCYCLLGMGGRGEQSPHNVAVGLLWIRVGMTVLLNTFFVFKCPIFS